jgi:hypothetical protein
MRTLIVMLLLCCTLQSAELQLVGKAERDSFIRVQSDVPGRWIVLGPGVIAVKEVAPGIGLPILNRREVIVLEDRQQCVFVGPPGSYAIIQSPDEQGDFAFLPVVVEGSPEPEPKPEPDPDPDPEPDEVPADRFDDVGRLSFRLSGEHLIQQLSDNGARGQIGETANAYRDIVADYVDPTKPPNTLAQFQSVVKGRQVQIWGSSATVWAPWLAAINERYVGLHDAGVVGTREDVADFWRAVATGLEYSAR